MATTEFVTAAQSQSEALGFEPAYVFVEHPIQDRTDDELGALADTAIGALISALTNNAPV